MEQKQSGATQCFLTYQVHTRETIVFIELKDARNADINHAIEQLKETIESFLEYHRLES
jgi:hypothetical protein